MPKKRKKFINNSQQISVVNIDFSIEILEEIILYLFTYPSENPQITRKGLLNINNLFQILDKRAYENDESMLARIYLIQKVVSLELNENVFQPELLISKALESSHREEIENSILPMLDNSNVLTMEEIRFINKFISDRLQNAYLYKYKPLIEGKFEDLVMNNFDSISDINRDLKEILVNLSADIRRAELEEESNADFDFSDVNFESNLIEIVNEIKKPTSKLKTGMQLFNQMLNGGVESGRLYLILGITGGFKSGILLNLLFQIKKYNPNFRPNNPDKIPTILYITQENSMKETMERMWSIGCSDKDIKECSNEKILKMFKKKGGLKPDENSNINIRIMYRANKSISTDDLYSIYDDLMDEGQEVICVIHDYTKRIKPASINGELRIDLANIIDEECLFAKTKNIPFITAGQLNRKAMEMIEEAINSGKKNAIEKLGASNVGESWGMLENADWVGLIQKEEIINSNNPDDTTEYLAIKQLKFRGKKIFTNASFTHPFVKGNGMKLVDDEGMDKPASISSLSVISDGGNSTSDNNGFKTGKHKKVESARRSSKAKLKAMEDELDEELKDFD